jgi:cytidylate kinase
MALYLHRNGVSAEDTETIAKECTNADISIRYQDNEQVVLLNGENVNPYLRTEEVSRMSSNSSAVPEVRAHLLALQRNLASTYNVVMDGRDIGTTVFPDAELKIFMTADTQVRAQRRYDEMVAKGETPSFEDVLKNLQERDYIDSHREVSPLSRAEDAYVMDNKEMTMHEELVWITGLIQGKFGILE